MFGLAEYVRAGGGDGARALALQTLDALEMHAHDDEHGGYVEFFAPDWSPAGPRDTSPLDIRPPTDKLINTQMHLMEAMVAAHRVNLDPRAKTRAVELVDVIASRAVRRRFGAPMTDAWGADWRARKLDRTVRYGHLIELAWLLVDSADAVGVHQDAAREHGRPAGRVRAASTGLTRRVGSGARGSWDDRPTIGGTNGGRRPKPSWRTRGGGPSPSIRPTPTGCVRSGRSSEHHVEDHVVGEWHDELDTARNGHGPKGGAWKDGYHSTRALLDSATRLRTLGRSPNE